MYPRLSFIIVMRSSALRKCYFYTFQKITCFYTIFLSVLQFPFVTTDTAVASPTSPSTKPQCSEGDTTAVTTFFSLGRHILPHIAGTPDPIVPQLKNHAVSAPCCLGAQNRKPLGERSFYVQSILLSERKKQLL